MEVMFDGVKIGDFYADFVIDGKILLETKMILRIMQDEVKQVLRYLDALELKLAIIANFKHPRLETKRVVR